jgi:hypothetical protein
MGGLQMSYTQRYSASVSYHGSVSYSYPASQNGGSGSAPYSGSVPVNVTIYVNTDPFDGSVDRFKTSIGALGASVIAMNAAQCAAIKQTATDVSNALINGFFGTINTELSQQLQALDSAIKAGFGLIQQQGKAVTEKNETLESDYNRITSRYIKLFNDLDNECYKRIFALDKQSFNLSEKVQMQLLIEPSSNAAAMNLLGIEDESSSRSIMFISFMNRKTLEVLKTLQDYITQESKISSLVESLLFNEETDENIPVSIPVIWSESDMLDGGINRECFIPSQIDQQGKQDITEKVNGFCSEYASSGWRPSEETEKESLNREFNAMAESYFADKSEETEQRIYKTMLSLWQNAELFSFDKGVNDERDE